ncbi:GNAT family N-acetyltransferase [Chelatococcus sp. SYSU_G07232]|uniref:GNAT family N-acetyltransferase n=1 Tax=Chelatococcus albus TaxID=3047466 RepID=A0ABT7ACY9_9HYPH|nr:GNAT family N-acetyltransferase [Chelatococcus sp. SYSU_G07232]MDJ1157244.1 GNAT family N-acetyltransferase [Chelatococcus sp. SYSU_G07232]
MVDPAGIEIVPLTPERWADIEDLFGPERGAQSGCWCLWPLLPRKDFRALAPAERKAQFRARVESGPPLGLLAYADRKAVGWCAVAPRTRALGFDASRLSRAELGDAPSDVFAITCFHVRAGHRRKGLTPLLAKAAIADARAQGARAVEACPIDTGRELASGEGFVGLASVFHRLGFREIARRSPQRPLMRLDLHP